MPSGYDPEHEQALLLDLLPEKEGTYIDIGAGWHKGHSTTFPFFFKRAWSGILVEPHPVRAGKLRAKRPHDILVQAALSDRPGEAWLSLTETEGHDTIHPARAALLKKQGKVRGKERVPVKTLKQVLDQWPQKAAQCSFVSVDVEGHEMEVLAGAPLQDEKWHPRVWLIESNKISRPKLHAFMKQFRYVVRFENPVNTLFLYQPKSWH